MISQSPGTSNVMPSGSCSANQRLAAIRRKPRPDSSGLTRKSSRRSTSDRVTDVVRFFVLFRCRTRVPGGALSCIFISGCLMPTETQFPRSRPLARSSNTQMCGGRRQTKAGSRSIATQGNRGADLRVDRSDRVSHSNRHLEDRGGSITRFFVAKSS